MHYSIYIPQVSNPDVRHLERVGLGDLIRPNQPRPKMAEVLANGPDKGSGLYVFWNNSEQNYRPNELVWKPAKADPVKGLPEERFYWGVHPNSPVTAADLQRPETLAGEQIFGGGDVWLMPNILLLPSDFVLDNAGKWEREVSQSHRKIYDRCMWCYRVMRAYVEQREALPVEALIDYSLEMLSLNYTIFRDLASELRLLGDKNWVQVASRSIDFESLIKLQEDLKKKPQEASPKSSTSPTSPPGDGPAV